MFVQSNVNPLLKVISFLILSVLVMYFTQETIYLGLIILYLLASIYIKKNSDLSLIAIFRKYETSLSSNILQSLISLVTNYFLFVSLFLFILHVLDISTTNIIYVLIFIHLALILLVRKKIKTE